MKRELRIVIIRPHVVSPRHVKVRSYAGDREDYIARFLRSQGNDCNVFEMTLESRGFVAQDSVGTRVFPVDNPGAASNKVYVSTPLLEALDQERPDIVIFKGLGYRLASWLVANSRTFFNVAFIVGGGTSDRLLGRCDYVLAETPQQMNRFFPDLVRDSRAAVLPKYLEELQVAEPLGSKTIDVINIGHFIPRKNQMALRPFFGKCRVALIGDGELYATVREAARPHGNRVLMPGSLAHTDVWDWLSRSKLLVHPALHEGFPRVFAEAFSCGVPIVALRRTVGEAFVDGEHGILVEPEDLVPETMKLLEDEARLLEMSHNVQVLARKLFSKAAIEARIEEMLRRVIVSDRGKVYAAITKRLVQLKMLVRP